MNIREIIITELDNTSIKCDLNEGWFMTTPFIAFTAFKQGVLNKLSKNGFLTTAKKVASSHPIDKVKSDVLIQKEKIRHDTGISGKGEDETVYKLTPEQMKVMGEVYRKYGNKLINEIHLFRRNILAPYQLIKRLVKKNKSMTFKEVHGLSYDDYKSALESGRKKILKRGDVFNKVGEKHGKVDEYDELLNNLTEIRKNFNNGNGDSKVINSLMDKVYEKYNVSSGELYGFTADELKNITDTISSNTTHLKYIINHPEGKKSNPTEIIDFLEKHLAIKNLDVSSEHMQNLLASMNKENIKSGELNLAVAKYLLRKEIRNSIKSSGNNEYQSYYKVLIDEMIKKITERRRQMVGSSALDRSSIDFNEKEKKVWELLPTKKAQYTGNIEDYYLKIKDSDFKGVKHFEKPEGVEGAQRTIESEIKRFERKLSKILSPEDLAKLKKYRLINNLITVKELKDSGSLFKSDDELGSEEETTDEQPDDSQDGNVSEEEFVTRLKEYSTMELSSMAELGSLKKQVDELIIQMRKQGDTDVLEKYRELVSKVRGRKDIKQVDSTDSSEVKTIGDIKQFALNMLRKKYQNVDEMDQDNSIFNKMIDQYRKGEPDADKNLKEIKFILTQVEKKLGQSLQGLE